MGGLRWIVGLRDLVDWREPVEGIGWGACHHQTFEKLC